MSESVKLVVPADAAYEALGVDLARKYLEIAGGSARDAAALGDALSTAVARATQGAGPAAEVSFTFELEEGSVVMHVRCGDRSISVRQPLPVPKPS